MNNQDKLKLPIAGVILAAGAASRMGQSKLLLSWKGEALICHAVRTALQSELASVIVVTGASAEEIRNTLAGFDITLVHNPDWQEGQSTSVRAGLQAVPNQVEAAIFLLGDQPYVSPDLIQALVQEYRNTRPAILAPFVGDRRTNPVLFDRSMFKVLTELQGDAGARTIFKQYPPIPMPWFDDRLLLDVDTQADYQHLINSSD